MGDDPEPANIAAQILLLVSLILVNAFFAGAEMAVVSVNRNRIRNLATQGNKRAILIEKLSEDSTTFLSTIQVAITFAGFFSSASAATGISQVFAVQLNALKIPYAQTIAVVVVTVLLSYVTLVFGELIPKRVALQKAEMFSLFAVYPVYTISKIMAPFIKLLSLSTNGFLKLVGMKPGSLEQDVLEEEIKAMLQTGSETGVFNDIEKEMITSIFSFDDKKAKEVMTPRQEIVAIDLMDNMNEYIDDVLKCRHSRIPVYENQIDNIIGIVSMKDYMIQAKESSFKQVDIRKIMQPPYFVPEHRKIDELFKEMQSEKIRMAILIDEYGGVAGIATIEDLIEEIVGDIHEDYEEVETELEVIGENKYIVSGGIQLEDFMEKIKIKVESECDTLSGYLIGKLGYIPQEKELPLVIQVENVHYTIISMEERVIDSVRMEIDRIES